MISIYFNRPVGIQNKLQTYITYSFDEVDAEVLEAYVELGVVQKVSVVGAEDNVRLWDMFSNLPIRRGSRLNIYRGELANFILENWDSK